MAVVKQFLALKRCWGEDKVAHLLMGFRRVVT